MADGAQQSSLRYSAFISYSHADRRFVSRLHRRLEAYRLPKRLLAKVSPERLRGARLKPLFHDNSELTAAHDLPTALRDALCQAEYLIVVCSPASAGSDWVGLEVEFFRALHGDTRIITALLGSPETSFHPALRATMGGRRLEPLAADFRAKGDARAARLKLIAALAGVPLDDLTRRDAQREVRRVLTSASLAVAVMAAISALSVAALSARQAEGRQRGRAWTAVESLLKARDRLWGVSDLETRAALAESAFGYYRDQDLAQLSGAELDQRARILQSNCEDAADAGKLEEARIQCDEARRTTAKLLAGDPSDARRIFAHSQSEYWVGYIPWVQGDMASARASWESYAELVRELRRIDPNSVEYLSEAGDAESNLGTLAMRQSGNLDVAERHFSAALDNFQEASKRAPRVIKYSVSVADSYAWLADVQRLRGHLEHSRRSRAAQRRTLEAMIQASPQNTRLQTDVLANELAVARIEAELGEVRRAVSRLDRAHREAIRLMKADPTNAELAKQARGLELFKVRSLASLPPGLRPPATKLLALLGSCAPTPLLNEREITEFCQILRSRVLGRAERVRSPPSTAPTGRNVYSPRWGLDLDAESSIRSN